MQATVTDNSYPLRLTFGYYLLFIVLGLDIALTGPNLPALASQTNVRLGQMGFIFLAGSLGYIAGTLMGGRVFDRMKGNPVMGAAQIAAAAMIALVPIAPWFWLLLLITMIKGFFEGMINTGGNTLLTWAHGTKVAPYMNGLHFSFGVGAFISPLLVAQFIQVDGGYRWAYWIISLFALLVGIYIYSMPGSPAAIHKQTQTSTERVKTPRLDIIYIISAALFLFFYVSAELSYSGWLYTYAFTLNLASAAQAAYLTSVFWFSFTIGRLVAIPISIRLKPRLMILFALVGSIAFILLLQFIPSSSVILWISTIGFGFFMAPVYATGYTIAGQSIQLTGRNSGVILLGDSVGSLVLPTVVGQVLESMGPRAMVSLVFTSLIGNFLTFLVMLRIKPISR